MYKYEMTINGTEYKALFTDHFEASDFLTELDNDGDKVIVHGYKEVTAEEILTDRDFEHSYKIEMVAMMLLPNHKDFSKWTEQEAEMKKLGLI